MSVHRTPSPTFAITHETEPSETVVAGFSAFGLAGHTAVDYVVDQLELEETGHVTAESMPSIPPLRERPGPPPLPARPRVTVLVNELFVPVWAADADVPPMDNGFLDGVNASLMARGLDSDLRVGVFVTPVHAQTPDAEASVRLVEAAERVYGLGLDTADLEAFAAEIESTTRNSPSASKRPGKKPPRGTHVHVADLSDGTVDALGRESCRWNRSGNLSDSYGSMVPSSVITWSTSRVGVAS